MLGSDVLGPLADRQFRLLWLAATTSAMGSAFVPVAMAFAVLGIGGNATSLGIVLLVGTIAGLASYQVAGVWADRLSRRSLMLTADLVRLAVEAAVAALLLTGNAKIWELAVAGAIVSIGTAFEGPASTSLVPEIVVTEKLQQANSMLSISVSGSAVVGPALSGLMVATVGPGWAFALDAASFAGSGAFLLAMAPTARPEAARQHFLADLAAGAVTVVISSNLNAPLAALADHSRPRSRCARKVEHDGRASSTPTNGKRARTAYYEKCPDSVLCPGCILREQS